MSNVRIRDVRVILTEPDDIRLVIVKVETTEPELHGVGCATFTQRPTPVAAAVNDYLKPFLVGKDPADIEDIWQSSYVSSYWRNGPVLNNALSGVDQAQPVDDLLPIAALAAYPLGLGKHPDGFVVADRGRADARLLRDLADGERCIRVHPAPRLKVNPVAP